MHTSDLGKLSFGRDAAESDLTNNGLLRAGFLRTAIFEFAKSGRKSLILGGKGSGKSAICLMLDDDLTKDENSFSSVITPDEISAEEIRRFEMTGISREHSKKLVWWYIFLIQIARFLIGLARRHYGKESVWPGDIRRIRQFLVENGEVDDLSFREKFWRIIGRLKGSLRVSAFNQEFEVQHHGATEGLILSSTLEFLEQYLERQLLTFPSHRLFLLVDKLDDIWTNDEWSDLMVVGLLKAAQDINASFVNVRCIIFLRTDIYDVLQFHDRDKFHSEEARISWSPKTLEQLVLVRANASTDSQMTSGEFWPRYFPDFVDDIPINEFMISRTLKRPRDIIQLCNSCIDNARISGHPLATEQDVKDALQICFRSILAGSFEIL